MAPRVNHRAEANLVLGFRGASKGLGGATGLHHTGWCWVFALSPEGREGAPLGPSVLIKAVWAVNAYEKEAAAKELLLDSLGCLLEYDLLLGM